MNVFHIKMQHDGHKNAVLQVSGYLDTDIKSAKTIITLQDLSPIPKALRIESLVFALQEKMGLILWWKCKEETHPILPIEGKGSLNFADMQGLHSPIEGTDGLAITTFGVDKGKYFLLTLDLTKQ